MAFRCVATAYECPSCHEQAMIFLWQSGPDTYSVRAYRNIDNDRDPTWEEGVLDLPNAKCWAQIYQHRLTAAGMQRIR